MHVKPMLYMHVSKSMRVARAAALMLPWRPFARSREKKTVPLKLENQNRQTSDLVSALIWKTGFFFFKTISFTVWVRTSYILYCERFRSFHFLLVLISSSSSLLLFCCSLSHTENNKILLLTSMQYAIVQSKNIIHSKLLLQSRLNTSTLNHFIYTLRMCMRVIFIVKELKMEGFTSAKY